MMLMRLFSFLASVLAVLTECATMRAESRRGDGGLFFMLG